MKELPPSVSDESLNEETDASEEPDDSDLETLEPLKEAPDLLKNTTHHLVTRKRDRESPPQSCHDDSIKLKEEPIGKKTYLCCEEDEDIIVLN